MVRVSAAVLLVALLAVGAFVAFRQDGGNEEAGDEPVALKHADEALAERQQAEEGTPRPSTVATSEPPKLEFVADPADLKCVLANLRRYEAKEEPVEVPSDSAVRFDHAGAIPRIEGMRSLKSYLCLM